MTAYRAMLYNGIKERVKRLMRSLDRLKLHVKSLKITKGYLKNEAPIMAIPARAAKEVSMSIPEQVKRGSKLSEELSKQEGNIKEESGRTGKAKELQREIERLSFTLKDMLTPLPFKHVLDEVEYDEGFVSRRTIWDEGVYVELAVEFAKDYVEF